MTRLLAAVDGGNSKTELVLFDDTGQVLATARGGGTNPQKVGLDRVVGLIGELLGQAQVEADLLGTRVDVLAAFLAGLDFPAEVSAANDALTEARLADQFVVDNDTFALLHGAATRPYGVAVVCGAGINAVGIAKSGQRSSFLALGRISGDWGGSLCLGREALWYAARAEDGRGESSVLRDIICAHFGTASVVDVISRVHVGDISDVQLAEVVPEMFKPEHADDHVIAELLARQATEVATMAEVMLDWTELRTTEADVVLGGALLTAGHQALDGSIHERLAATAPHAHVRSIDVRPAAGAAVAALGTIDAGPDAVQRIKTQLGRESW
ncbi:BadF/BadG/BcrA/BcrD ATPase family protein [Haloactinopolyspora sp.]|uniref:N-acetylglucosamine kinase n=1 Tax=Haloactinopolyspora sp. TaxID=1966353 RepID=UPI002630CE8E|nr:BadF/BadG/BcrA/BcrD ATPase family protein [Haloactinopolyspora sp.]